MNDKSKKTSNKVAISDYEKYCQSQLEQMEDDMDGRCIGEMAEGQFVRSH